MDKFSSPIFWQSIKPAILNTIDKIIDSIIRNCDCNELKYKRAIELLKNLCAQINLSYGIPKGSFASDDEKILLEVLKEIAEYIIADKDKLEKLKLAIELKKQYNDVSNIIKLFREYFQ